MIEFCTKKRMAAAIVGLIGLSVVVLIIENRFSWEHDMRDVTGSPENSSNECGPGIPGIIKEECRPCTKFEMKAQLLCPTTGYIEIVKCPNNKEKWRSCPKITWVEEKNFWIFESCVALIGVASYTMVTIRQRRLDKLLLDKVHKQIAAGV